MTADTTERRPDLAAIRAAHPPDRDYPLGVDCGSLNGKVRGMLTVEGLAYAIYDERAMVEDMVETSCLVVEDFLDAVLPEISFDFASGWEDICFKSGPLVSIGFFKDVVVPRYRRIHEKLRAHGLKSGIRTATAMRAS